MEYKVNSPNKSFIIQLLKQDLITLRLLNGLRELGFDSDEYCLDISDMVFKLLDYKEQHHDAFFDTYFKFTSSLNGQKLSDMDFLDCKAMELYCMLTEIKWGYEG